MAAKIVEDTTGLVSIGQLAKAAGVSSRTIRYYEELGILPEPRRSPGGTRKYPREYRGYIDTALALKDLGFRLEEIKPLARLALGRSVSAGPAGPGGAVGRGPDRGAGPPGHRAAPAARLGPDPERWPPCPASSARRICRGPPMRSDGAKWPGNQAAPTC